MHRAQVRLNYRHAPKCARALGGFRRHVRQLICAKRYTIGAANKVKAPRPPRAQELLASVPQFLADDVHLVIAKEVGSYAVASGSASAGKPGPVERRYRHCGLIILSFYALAVWEEDEVRPPEAVALPAPPQPKLLK